MTVELSIIRDDLVNAVGHVQRVVETRNTIPILANILLRAGAGGLEVFATDLDIQAATTARATVAGNGATTVPAKMLYDIARKLPSGAPVKVSWNDKEYAVRISCGRSRFNMQSLPEADMPTLKAGEWQSSFSLPAKVLKRMIQRCKFAISTEETRYYLNGIHFHTKKGPDKLIAVATDGHRMSRVIIDLPDGADTMPPVIVPRKMVNEIEHLIDKLGDTNVDLDFSTNLMRIEAGGTELISKLIDGTFPDYQRVIPPEPGPGSNIPPAIVGNNELASAVDRVSTISSERGRAVKLSFEENGVLKINCTSPDNGIAEEEIEVEYDGPATPIGFNSRYVGDILRIFDGDKIEVVFSDPGAPVIFREPKQTGDLVVLMPMRV